MRFLLLSLIYIFALCSAAHGQTFLDKLGKRLDKFGNSVQRDILGLDRKLDKRFGNKTNRGERSVTCVVFDRNGTQTDQQPCTVRQRCRRNGRCTDTFVWPSGSQTVIVTRPGRAPRLNGKRAAFEGFRSLDCVTSRVTGNRFCWFGNGDTPHVVEVEPQPREEPQQDIDQIAALLGKEAVAEFYRRGNNADLPLKTAYASCEKEFVGLARQFFDPLPTKIVRIMRDRCRKGMVVYEKRIVRETADKWIAKTLILPTNLESLRNNNWFQLTPSRLRSFGPNHQRQVSRMYWAKIEGHYNLAVSKAFVEIREAFRTAVPLTDSSDKAIALCANLTRPPKEIAQMCKSKQQELKQRVAKARCDRALSESGASAKMLNMRMAPSGLRRPSFLGRRASTLSEVICNGANKRPSYAITIDNGGLFSSPSLAIHEGETKLLVVALRESSSRDDRSFGKLLLDIATGENEKEVPKTLVGEKILYRAHSIRWNVPESAIGCVLGFIKCGS